MLSSNLSGLEGALIAIAVLALFIVRQFSTRRVLNRMNILAPLALLYFGSQSLGQLDTTGWWLLCLSSSLGIAFGLARGITFRVWTDANGEALARGTKVTLALWLATFAAKIILSVLEVKLGLGSATSSTAQMLIPAAATLAAQTLVVYLRAQDHQVTATA